MLKVVKIGGNIINDERRLDSFLTDFAKLEGPKILVHGGGKKATELAGKLGIPQTMSGGRRVTDTDTLEIAVMVYAGLINKTIVNKLNALGCKAVGLSGADGEFIRAERRQPVPVDFGFVGDPVEVNSELVGLLAVNSYTVVAAPITTDGGGIMLNTNADTIAQAVAVAMSADRAVELIYCFEKNGVLLDMDNENSVVPLIDRHSFEELKKDGIVADGMLPKLENAFTAIDKGVKRVVICNAANILEPGYGGTSITGKAC